MFLCGLETVSGTNRVIGLKIYQKGKKLKETKVVQEQKDLSLATMPKDVVRRLHTSNRNLPKAVSSLEKVGEV